MIGKKYTLKNCTRIDIKKGKIAHEMTYFDQLAFLRQVGLIRNNPSIVRLACLSCQENSGESLEKNIVLHRMEFDSRVHPGSK